MKVVTFDKNNVGQEEELEASSSSRSSSSDIEKEVRKHRK